MNKKRKKLDLNILSTVLKPFFENCKQYTVRFFQITHPQKYFGNVLFGSSFLTHNVCTFDIKCNSWLKRILDLIAKKKPMIGTQVMILIFYMLHVMQQDGTLILPII